jgi:hypothetical protein
MTASSAAVPNNHLATATIIQASCDGISSILRMQHSLWRGEWPMEILITDVTEMGGGNCCVAGWDVVAKRMVRPLPNGSNWPQP